MRCSSSSSRVTTTAISWTGSRSWSGARRPRERRTRRCGRSRRRPGAVVVCGAILWPADLRRVPGGQAGVRPARAAEPGQDCRRPTDRRVAAVWNGVPDAAGAHLLWLVPRWRNGGIGGTVQRPRGLPQDFRGYDVSLVHGDPGGRALHARTGEPAARSVVRRAAPAGPRGPAPLRGAGSVPGVQRLQGGMSGERRYGQIEVRVSGPVLQDERSVSARRLVRSLPRREPVGISHGAAVDVGRRVRSGALGAGPVRRDRPAATAAAVRPPELSDLVEEPGTRERGNAGTRYQPINTRVEGDGGILRR